MSTSEHGVAAAVGTAHDTGTIHDIGYQRYTGPRLGRGHAVRALYAYSFRSVFGLGRSAKAKIFPFLIVGIFLVVGVVVAAVKAQFGVEIPQLSYVVFPSTLSFLLVLFLAVTTPELASRDLRNQVLPLYFSRPIGRDDYVLAKLAALVTAVTLVLGAPLFIMFLGGAFSASGASGVWSEFTHFVPGLLNALLYAIVLSAVTLLIASLSGRRTIAAGSVVAVFLVTAPITGVLTVLGQGTIRQLASLCSLTGIVNGLRTWLFGGERGVAIGSFGPLYALVAVVLVAVCTALLVHRYRKVAA